MQPVRIEEGLVLARYGRDRGSRITASMIASLSDEAVLAAVKSLPSAAQQALGVDCFNRIDPELLRRRLLRLLGRR